jgi:2-polyprenyl-3-methyl-5-hydroxy-6-metoxy-1,4-benzoquinol methylase
VTRGIPGRHDAGVDREDWDKRYAGRELIWTAQPNRFLAAEVAGLTSGRALDLGCGEGRNAVWLAEQGWAVTAVDFSEVALEKGERLADERDVRVTWVPADLRDYVPPQEAFELVTLLYVHLPAPERAAVHARAAGGVAPGGMLLVVGHDRSNIAEGHGGPQDPAILFTPEEVSLELPGLEVERAERVHRSVSAPDGAADAIDALVRARRRLRS